MQQSKDEPLHYSIAFFSILRFRIVKICHKLTCLRAVGSNPPDDADSLTGRQDESQTSHVTCDAVTWYRLQVHDVLTVEAQVEHRETILLQLTHSFRRIIIFYYAAIPTGRSKDIARLSVCLYLCLSARVSMFVCQL